MNQLKSHPRLMAVAPTARGFGFAVFEGIDTYIDWGVKSAVGKKNGICLEKLERLIGQHRPEVLILENPCTKESRRATRIKELYSEIRTLAKGKRLRMMCFSRTAVQKAFFGERCGTKYDIAQIVFNRFGGETNLDLPPKRKLGHSEDPRMDTFEAIALIVTYRKWNAERTPSRGGAERCGRKEV